GTAGCKDSAVLAGTDLQLLLEEPLPLHWAAVGWKVALGAESWQRILTVREKKVDAANSSHSRRATFHWVPPSLNISAVTQADSGNYSAEIESSDGSILINCFHVSVWEPVGNPRVETHVLQQEQGQCHLKLSCTVPGATAVSYSWSRDRELLGNQSVLVVHQDVQPGLYVCNVSNPANWKTASVDTDTACTQTGLFGAIPWWAVALLLVLIICTAGSITYWCWRRKKDHPAEHAEPSQTIYEEVGRAQTGQEPNRNSELHVVGNTVYTTVHPRAQQGPRYPQTPESCTIYSTVQPRTKQFPTSTLRADPRSASQSPSFKRKKLDRALVSTAYMEVTGTGQRGKGPAHLHSEYHAL
ncbi:CD244 protein, partial [Odontophorus gujanensis]|nr:CD244 protein [Odontophorus gujanensis]